MRFYLNGTRDLVLNIYPNGVILKEEAMAIKEQLQNSDFNDFSASDGWLDCWKTTYSVKESCIVDKAGDMLLPGWR